MRHFIVLGLLVSAVLGSGCASRSLTENQCVAGDWQTVGYRDGQQGHDQTRLLTHQDACGEFGVIPDRERYVEGWRQGVAMYCRSEHGYELGERGSSYSDVCPAAVRDPFLDAYAHGRELYLARSDVQRLESTLARNHRRMESIDSRVIELAAAQVVKDLSPERRVELFTETKNLLDEKKRIEHDMPFLERDLELATRRLGEVQRVG